ncbi:MAG: hypothetical protein CL878_02345 [Dehalococcoidia bacterium]|nr:hypothetical protein [Dehalococcoidia bacterium]
MEDIAILVLRIIHIGFGAFWVGAALFLAFVLEPRLRALGPATQGPVMQALMPVMNPVFSISALLTILAGLGLALVMRWSTLDTFLASAWGWSILIGAVLSVIGGMNGRTGQKMKELTESMQGRPPTPDEGQQLGELSTRLRTFGRVASVVVLLALVAMATARFA